MEICRLKERWESVARNEKSLAVECMHRLSKHLKDSLRDDTKELNREFWSIFQVWTLRKEFEGEDLNKCLETLRKVATQGMDGLGWKETRGKISSV